MRRDVDGPALTAINLAISVGQRHARQQRQRHLDLSSGAQRRHVGDVQLCRERRRGSPGCHHCEPRHHAGERCAGGCNAIADQGTTRGSAFTVQFAANTFNDVDTGDTLNYTATLSDGSTLPSWLGFDAATGRSPTPRRMATSARRGEGDGNRTSNASASDTFDITVGNTNDQPVNDVPAGTLTVNDDVPLGFGWQCDSGR